MKRQRKITTRVAVLAFALTLVIAAMASPAPALADTTPASSTVTPPDSSTFLAAQNPNEIDLIGLKSWILARPGIENSGYIESVDDVANRTTTLLWNGPANATQRAIVAEGKSRGITVEIRQRKFSRSALMKAAADAGASANRGAFGDFKVTSIVAIDPDYDGIILRGTQTAAAPAARTALAQTASAQFGVDVAVQPGAVITPTVGTVSNAVPAITGSATRSNDKPAFNSGGYMLDTQNHVCSTGFALWYHGTAYTTTARHCWFHTFHARNNSGTSYGDGLVNSPDGAARLMTTGGYYWNFDGAWNNTAGYKKTVVGYGPVSTGDSVCNSGGNSGVRCGIQVERMCVMWDDGMGFGSVCTIEGHQTSNGIAAIQGDSGGPVFTLASGTDRVNATGMIEAVEGGWTNCTGVHDGGTNICSDWVLFTSTQTIANSLGASLRTG